MRLYLRNKATTEIREVEADSSEFRELVRQVTPGGLPMWEQTNFPHADQIRQRAKTNSLLPEDLGEEDKDDLRYAALQLDLEGVAPEHNPHLALTPAEIENGLTPEDKLADLQEMYDQNRLTERGTIYRRAAERVVGEGNVEDQVAVGAGGSMSARAGGSDDRDNVERPDAQAGSRRGQQQGDDAGDSSPQKTTPRHVAADRTQPPSGGDGGTQGGDS